MKALVIGLGSMGRRRVRCLRQLGVQDIAGFDFGRTACGRGAGRHRRAQQLAAADLDAFDVVVISTPPDQHHTALGWVSRWQPSFVEASVICSRCRRLTMRPAPRASWSPPCTHSIRPCANHADRPLGATARSATSPTTAASTCRTGIPGEKVSDTVSRRSPALAEVPFELTWMVDAFGWPRQVQGTRLRPTDVGAPIDDTYAALLQFDGFVGTLIVDVVARQAVRKLTLNFERASLSWDWDAGVVRVWEADPGRLVELHQPKSVAHAGYHQNIGEAMYVAEIASFLAAAQGRGRFPHTLQDDIRVLSLLEEIEA